MALEAMRNIRFVSMCCGRRWGKTQALIIRGGEVALSNNNQKIWWVDPTNEQAFRIYELFRQSLPAFLIDKQKKTRGRLIIHFTNGSFIHFQSAEKEDNLLGEGLDLLLINEASLVSQNTWQKILRPMLSDRGGSAVFAYTPRGQGHWTYPMFVRGMSSEREGYKSFTFPTSSNPRIPAEEIDEARETLPEDIFRQEYLAVFLEDGAGVFRGIDKCIQGVLDEPGIIPIDGPYYAGLDLARTQDFSVLTILNRYGHVCWFERINQVEWLPQRERFIKSLLRYNAHTWVDAESMGDVVQEDLRRSGVSVNPFKFSNQSKSDLIQGLQVAIEHKDVTFPAIKELNDPTVGELRIYQYEILPSRKVRYNAPQGFHDDCVISLALAVANRRFSGVDPTVKYLGDVNIGSLVAGGRQ